MKRYITATWALTKSSTLAYFRDFTAVFFTLIFPVLFLLVFGFISTRGEAEFNVAIYNNSSSELAGEFETAVKNVQAIKTDKQPPNLEEAKTDLTNGDLNYILVIPENFGQGGNNGLQKTQITAYYNEANHANTAAVSSIVGSIVADFNNRIQPPPEPIFSLNQQPVRSSGLTAIDYLLPGILAFSIMSLGLFGVANGFVTYKSSGSLRRLHVAPVSPSTFLAAQTFTRLISAALSVIIMLIIGYALFDFSLRGSFLLFMMLSIFGACLFLAMGFAVAGWAKNENQAAPLANIIFFPMMFLSGTFFPRELFPDWIRPISEYLPLTYLADGLRMVANDAAGIADLTVQIAGMTVWLVISFVIAIKVFRWE